MTRSGCSPGSPVPADTPQEGVRSPRVTKEMLQGRLDGAWWALLEYRKYRDYAGTAKAAQVVADTARALSTTGTAFEPLEKPEEAAE